MRVFNPFRITDAPDHMVLERTLRHRHMFQTLALCSVVGAVALYATPLVIYLYDAGIGAGPDAWAAVAAYWHTLLGPDPWAPHRVMLNDPNFVPFHVKVIPGRDDPKMRVMLAYITVVGTAVIAAGLRQLTNPHRRMVMKQDASWCDAATLRRMEGRKQVGVRNGFLMELGKWPSGLRGGQPVKMIETLSLLCLAPPGTGKTAGLVIPTIVGCDQVSMVVNDSKPELYEATGAERAKCSHVIVMDWAKVDETRLLVDADTGKPLLGADGVPRVRHYRYAKFNPLSKRMVPGPGADRDTYISTVAHALIPKKDSKGDNDYFANKGRDALTGMIHMIVARVNDRAPDDALRYDGMPEHWKGKEASLPMLSDWIAHSQFRAGNGDGMPPADSDSAFDGQPAAPNDGITSWLKGICNEINPETAPPDKDGHKLGTTDRGFTSLSQLVGMADKERSGVLGTMDEALLPFKNAAVKQRTEDSDFTPDDLRGMRDEDGNWKPVTLYVCVNQAEADAFATLTALLYEVLSRSLLTYKPNAFNPRTKRTLGPYPVCFCLDEFAQLPKMPAVLKGPDIGRSMGVSYMFVTQSSGQLETRYSKPEMETLYTTTSVKYILPQNDNGTIQTIINWVGKTTIRRGAHSYSEGMGKDVSAFKWNRSDTMEETDFLRNKDVIEMPQGRHMVLVQEYMNRPMMLETALFFKDPEMARKVWSRGAGPVATEVIPRHSFVAKVRAWEADLRRRAEKGEAVYAQMRTQALTKAEQLQELA